MSVIAISIYKLLFLSSSGYKRYILYSNLSSIIYIYIVPEEIVV